MEVAHLDAVLVSVSAVQEKRPPEYVRTLPELQVFKLAPNSLVVEAVPEM